MIIFNYVITGNHMKIKMVNLLIIILILSAISVKSNNDEKEIHYEEITEDQLNGIRTKLLNENSESEREFLIRILTPEISDLNKDRKISRNELRSCLDWVLYPQSNEEKQKIDHEIRNQLDAGINVWVSRVKPKLNYKEFQYILSKIRTELFIDLERAKKTVEARKVNIETGEDL